MRTLHLQRCRNHATREAAARCPSCRRFFCRECVVEHGGRFLCVGCLQRVTGASGSRRRRWLWLRVPVRVVTGLVVAWFCFGLFGRLLIDIPDEFHDGSYWRFLEEGEP